MRIVVVGPLAASLVAFRGELLRSMVAQGHEVLGLAPEEDPRVRDALAAMGVGFGTVPLRRTGMNPVRDAVTTVALARAFRGERAELAFVYTAKPVIYGLLAARLAGVPCRAAMITGVGSALAGGGSFGDRSLAKLVETLYRIALRFAHVVIFQNPDDEALFRRLGLVGRRHRIVLVNGSGVDLDRFAVTPHPPPPVTFLMIARLVREKGLFEYVEAARLVKHEHPDVRVQLLGPLDDKASGIGRDQVDAWAAEGIIEYLGATDDVRPYLRAAHVCVLPSYHEGTPRSILEAMSMGRAAITTDAPGCRETVRDGVNGFLVPVRDGAAVASAMRRFIDEPGLAERMGDAGRALAEERFDVHAVNRVIIDALGVERSQGE
jgi:glycosyltransferase involved in cell wall biosynthesis